MKAECIWPAGATLGEGGLWDPATGRLWWVDIKRPAVHRYTPATDDRWSWTPPCRVTALGLTTSDRLIASTDFGFALIDPAAGTLTPIDHPEPHLPGNRFNDGKVDPLGRFWAGTMDDAEESAAGSVYRLDAAGGHERMAAGFQVPNGPAFDPGGRHLYLSDTACRETYRLEMHEAGGVSERTLFASFTEAQGYPDGMTVDADHHLWIAFWGGGCVRRLDPQGRIVAEVPLPVGRPTSCVFGGERLDQLFVTSASVGLSEAELAEQPLAGGLFRIATGVTGVAPPRFG